MDKHYMIHRFHPAIHYANRLACRPGDQFGPRLIHDYQFIFVQRGTGQLRIGRQTYRAVPGSLFHYGPGEPHLIQASKDDPFVLFGLHFHPEGDLEENIPAHGVQIVQLQPNSFEQYEPLEGVPGDWSMPHHLQTGMWPLPYFEMFTREFAEEKTNTTVLMRGLFMQFCVTLLRWIQDNRPAESPLDRYVLIIRDELEKRALDDFDPNWLEQWTPYSADYITRLFRSRFGDTPNHYHTNRKMVAAKQLLEATTLSVSDIAERLHFGSIHYFCKWFKRLTGEQPTAYRKRRRLL